jgi:ABC-type branched-subunit amino acid transport system substrate-binding protein
VKRLAGRRAALALGLVGAALTTMGASRCGTTSTSTVTVSGTRLTIYASDPSSSASPLQTDVADAEQLALKQFGSTVNKYSIRFVQLHQKPSSNARTAIQDSTAIAYLGEIGQGVSAGTMGITNDQDLLQVTPTDTALQETQSTPAVPGAPNNYYEAKGTYGLTFGRVVPSSAAEAKAQVQMMQVLHVKKLYVAHDGSPYGAAIAYAIRQQASSGGLAVMQGAPATASVTSSGADAVFYGATGGAGWLSGVGGRARVFVPSALASTPSALTPGTYVSQPGFLPRNLPATATSQFIKPFEATYGHAPATEAIFGYEAMAAVLGVLREAGSSANNRSTVVHDFFAIKGRSSVLGTYSIDSTGDPTTGPFVFSQLRNGALAPFRFLQVSP